MRVAGQVTSHQFRIVAQLRFFTSVITMLHNSPEGIELLSNLVFEGFGSYGDLVGFGGFNSVFERDACDDFGEIVKAA